MTEKRNAEMVENLTQDFTGRNEFTQDGARLGAAIPWINRDGGGGAMFGFTAQSSENMGEGSTTSWSPLGTITYANYAATANGGPYVRLNGAALADYYSIPTAAWQYAGAAGQFFVWKWAKLGTIAAANMTIAAKYLGPANCSWWLGYNVTAGVFQFTCNGTGAPGNDVALQSSVSVSTGVWYFVAGHFDPGVSMTIGVAAASAGGMSGAFNTLTGATVPAVIFNGAAALTLGSISGGGLWWDDALGVGMARAYVPAGNIQGHMARLFGETKWFYDA